MPKPRYLPSLRWLSITGAATIPLLIAIIITQFLKFGPPRILLIGDSYAAYANIDATVIWSPGAEISTIKKLIEDSEPQDYDIVIVLLGMGDVLLRSCATDATTQEIRRELGSLIDDKFGMHPIIISVEVQYQCWLDPECRLDKWHLNAKGYRRLLALYNLDWLLLDGEINLELSNWQALTRIVRGDTIDYSTSALPPADQPLK